MASSTTTVIVENVMSNRDSMSRSDLPSIDTNPKIFFTSTARAVSSHESDTESQPPVGRRLDEFEVSDGDLQTHPNSTSALQTFSDPPMNKYRLLAVSLMFMTNGINDSAAGVLILHMEKTYHIGYALVSIIFVATAIGFILASLFTDSLNRMFGAAKTLAIAESLKLAAYTLIAPVLPYPVACVAFVLIGCAMSLELGIGITFATNLANGDTMLGIITGSYSLGGIMGPLLATSLTSHGVLWARFYLITLGFTLINIFLATWSFWSHEKDSQAASLPPASANNALPMAGKFGTMKKALRNKVTILAAFFLFVYQGAEVTVSGWVITYLITYRNGDPSSVGYVTAGFWAGITIGRFMLTKPLTKLGEKRINYVLIVGAMVFEAIVWAVPNVIGDAVAVCIVGLLVGPIYPIACNMFVKLLPSDIQVASVSLIQGMGSSGGAALPFITGVLAQVEGTFVVHPVVLAALALELGSWYMLPSVLKRDV